MLELLDTPGCSAPKLQGKSGRPALGLSTCRLRTQASAGQPSQSSTERDSRPIGGVDGSRGRADRPRGRRYVPPRWRLCRRPTRPLPAGYLAGRPPPHSAVSRDLSGPPPLLIQVAGYDICHDDGVRLAAKAREAGVDVTFTEYPTSEHIFIVWGSMQYVDGAIVDTALDPEPPRRAAQEMSEFARIHMAPLDKPITA